MKKDNKKKELGRIAGLDDATKGAKEQDVTKIEIETDYKSGISERRRESYLGDALAQMLIQQIKFELNNHYLYYNFAIWYDINSYFGQAAYFYHRAAEERTHAQWIIDYLNQADYLYAIPATDPEHIDIYQGQDPISFATADHVQDPHNITLDREIQTTRSINAIKRKAIEVNDYITDHWLRDLLLEQAEEESLSHTALDIFQHTHDILVIDKYFKDVVMSQLEQG